MIYDRNSPVTNKRIVRYLINLKFAIAMEKTPKSFKDFIPNAVTLIGVPTDENSSFMNGCAKAPAKIREILYCGASNFYSELGVNIEDESVFCDCGDLKFDKGEKGFGQIESKMLKLLKRGGQILSLGGDHAITYPIVRAFQQEFRTLNILHFDAHSDTYDAFEGNRLSHASPFARIMEENLVENLTQVGIRTLTDHQRQQNERFGIKVIEARDFKPGMDLELKGPLYISIDLDVFDPAYTPGVSHQEPGGLTVRQIVDIIHNIQVPIAGADIVEFNPSRDVSDMTANVAIKLVKELSGKMIRQKLLGRSTVKL